MSDNNINQRKSLRRKLTNQYLGIFTIVYFILLVGIMLTIITAEYINIENHTINIVSSKLQEEETIINKSLDSTGYEKHIISYAVYDKLLNPVDRISGEGGMPEYAFLHNINVFYKLQYFTRTGDTIYSFTSAQQSEHVVYIKFDLFNYSKDNVFLLEIVVLIIIFGIGYLLGVLLFAAIGNAKTKKALKPIHDLTVLASSINENNMNLRIDVESARYELKELCITINSMLQRIETVYKKQKTFVSDVSHELRTPISIIDGYMNMLKRWGSTDEIILNESIEAILSETKSMKELVEALLFLARYDHQSIVYEKEGVDLSGLLEDVYRETTLLDKEKHKLSCTIGEGLTCIGDYRKLKECIRIFMDNSLKYTEKGRDIHLSGQGVGANIMLSIKDKGIGISKEHLGNIFNRFYRAEESRDKKTGGSGLGLAIARAIILAHNGKIKIFSKEDSGTTVEIYLPKAKLPHS